MADKTKFQQLLDDINAHINSTNNPHEVNSKGMLGLDKVDNTSDANKPVTTLLANELSKKMNVSDIYNFTKEDEIKDLTTLPWSAAQGYSMNNTIDAYQKQDTSELEARIAKCENDV